MKQGYPGIKLASGDVALTKSGRHTTPFPKVDLSSERKAIDTVKRVDKWLIFNAKKEAQETGDEWSLLLLSGIDPRRPSQADKDTAEDYLWGAR
jgi:hypothetical protein